MRIARYRPYSQVESDASQPPALALLLRGRLSGMGRTAVCDLLAWRIPRDPRNRFTQFRVITAPENLPDGVYLVEFDRQCCFATRSQGQWKIEALETDIRA